MTIHHEAERAHHFSFSEIVMGQEAPPHPFRCGVVIGHDYAPVSPGGSRSEEHTSELQSLMRLPYADLRLKKKIQHDTDKKKYKDINSHSYIFTCFFICTPPTYI